VKNIVRLREKRINVRLAIHEKPSGFDKFKKTEDNVLKKILRVDGGPILFMRYVTIFKNH